MCVFCIYSRTFFVLSYKTNESGRQFQSNKHKPEESEKKVDRNKDKTNKNEKNSKNHNFMDINPLLRGSLQNIHISEDSLKLGIIVWITVNGKMKRVDTFTVQLLERWHNYLASKI